MIYRYPVFPLAVFVLSLWLSCTWLSKPDKENRTVRAAAPQNAQIAADNTESTIAFVPQQAPLSENDAKALIDRWLSTQNDADFDSYASLFAGTMRGTKIGIFQGESTRHGFNRAGWLKDRKKLFADDYEVEIDALTFRVEGDVIVASFTQTWTSAGRSDVGQKEITIGRQKGKAKIFAEAMLSVRSEPGSNAGVQLVEYYLGKPFWMVAEIEDTPPHTDLKPMVKKGLDLNVASTLADSAFDQARFPGASDRYLLTATGGHCSFSIGKDYVFSGYDDYNIYEDGDEPYSERPNRAKYAWQDGQKKFVRSIRKHGCKGTPLVVANNKPHAFVRRREPSAALKKQLREQFHADSLHQEIQERYVAHQAHGGEHKAEYWYKGQPFYDVFEFSNAKYAVVSVETQSFGCGDLGGYREPLYAIFKLGADGIEALSGALRGDFRFSRTKILGAYQLSDPERIVFLGRDIALVGAEWGSTISIHNLWPPEGCEC